MSALYLQAIRTLPEHLVNDSTQVTEFRGFVVAANPHHPPMMYDPGIKLWSEIQLHPGALKP